MPPLRTILALLLIPMACPAAAAGTGFAPIDLSTTPIANFLSGSDGQVFGPLRFRGGLIVESSDGRFGSLSGLDIAPDGTLTAVSDTGHWFRARLIETDGRLTGLADGQLAPILDDKGNPYVGKHLSDAEGLRILRRGARPEAYISFEQVNLVRRYFGPDFAVARAVPVKVPLTTGKLPRNEGLEAIAMAPPEGPLGGATVLIAEHALNADGNHRGWIVGGPRAGGFAIRRSDEFEMTDATFLPDGDLLVLERRFNYSTGVAMRLRRIAARDLISGATVDGPVLIDASMRYQIDNMEGIAARTGPAGQTIIDIVSDDNNSIIQRTVLLQFLLDSPPAPPAAAAPLEIEATPRATLDASVPVKASPPLPRPRPAR